MTKQSTPAQKSTTHFEQIPLDIVKKIALADVSEGAPHFHGVQFYSDVNALCSLVSNFIGEGLEKGAVAVIIATPDHAARIESCLRTRAIDVDTLKGLGGLVTFDARTTLEPLMMGGMPNPGAFRRTIGAMLTQVRRGREHRAIRAYGEMVDVLWKDGLEAAAIRLETLWNQLAGTQDFDLLCGYSMGNFYKAAALDQIKGQHTHLVDDGGGASALANLAPSHV